MCIQCGTEVNQCELRMLDRIITDAAVSPTSVGRSSLSSAVSENNVNSCMGVQYVNSNC